MRHGSQFASTWLRAGANTAGRGPDGSLLRHRVIPSRSWQVQLTAPLLGGISRTSTNSNWRMARRSADLTPTSTRRSSMKDVSDSPTSTSASNLCTSSTLATTGRISARSPRKVWIHWRCLVWCPVSPFPTSGGAASPTNMGVLGMRMTRVLPRRQIPNCGTFLRCSQDGGHERRTLRDDAWSRKLAPRRS